jgi:uncharacterized protein (UPF0332 family)
MAAVNLEEVSDYKNQARKFMAKGWEYLDVGDLHQASEKGWGAAAHMAKAVALCQGWVYESHAGFNVVMNEASRLTGNDRLRDLRGRANDLHSNFYLREIHLADDAIRADLSAIRELLELLEPLTTSEGPE